MDVKRTMHRDQERFILERHYGLLLGSLLINLIKMLKKKRIIFTDVEQAFIKIQYSFSVKTLRERTKNKNILSQHNKHCLWPTSSQKMCLILIFKALKSRMDEGWLLATLLFVIVLDVLVNETSKETYK